LTVVLGPQASSPARVARNQVGYINDLFVNTVTLSDQGSARRGQAGTARSQSVSDYFHSVYTDVVQTHMLNEDTSTRSWNAIAESWASHADNNDYRNFFLMPRMLKMLGDVYGKRILDLGCGEGGYARELKRRGADIVGVDGSDMLVQIAHERADAEELNISFICANANALDGISENSFDLVVAAMSLMDVEDYPGAVREIRRVLCSGGSLLMSITHPCFSARISQWERPPDNKHDLLFFKVDNYFEREVWEDKITRDFSSPVLRRHRPLEDYVQVLLHEGFLLRHFSEAEPTADELKKSYRFRKLTRIPYFLFMRWEKI
jgi:ubiquinone/menaquinone biosynthesis C-methylase UbiE